ncbi:MAG: DUF3987 domain-containing protein [Okeania sp. SIO2H7]|nr:DUF3987 domain-containing protein [Okeania sp. SIO2H7]
MKPTVNELIQGLNQIPEAIALTPNKADKKAYRENWTTEPALARELIISDITKGIAKGYGIRLGEVSGGIVAIDEDGEAAAKLAVELSNGEAPKTVAFTSGKPYHCQRLYKIPEQYWGAIKTKKIDTGTFGDDGKPVLLEFRWNKLQSTLPPSTHPQTGKYYYLPGCSFEECAIADAPLWVIEQMLVEKKSSPQNTLRTPKQYEYKPFTEEDYLEALSYIPLAEHDSYDEWVKIGMACHAAGLQCEDWDKWSQGSPSYQPNGCWKHWKHFKEKSSGITAGTLIYFAQKNGWRKQREESRQPVIKSSPSKQRNGEQKSKTTSPSPNSEASSDFDSKQRNGEQKSKTTSAPPPPSSEMLTEKELIDAIDGLINRNLTFDKLYLEILKLAKISDFSENQILKIYDARLLNSEKETSLSDVKREIEEIIKARDTSINLSEFISPNLGWRLQALGRELNIKPEVFLCCLLTAMSALYKVGTKITLWRATGFRVSPNLFGAIVAESSQKKSPIIKNIITEPFKKLRERTRTEYEHEKQEYDQQLAYFKSLKGEEQINTFPQGPPKAPRKRQHLFSKATGESIYTQFETFPNQGMCYLVDELAGLFKSLDQYRGGKGSDEEDLLSLYDGEGATVLRADGTRVDLDNTLLSIFGSIQPGVLGKLRKDATDANGKWARFLFVNQPLAAATLGDNDTDEKILGDVLEHIYLTIDELPEMQFYLGTEAKSLFKEYYAQLERQRINHPNPAIRTIIGKTIGRIGKLAINLHCLNACCDNEEITEVIDCKTLQSAVNLALWFAQQAIYTISLLEEPDEENLAPHFVKVLEIAEKLKTVKARDIGRSYTSKYRPKAKQIREWFITLAQMGYGQTVGTGTRLGFSIDQDGDNGGGDNGGTKSPTPNDYPHCPQNVLNDDISTSEAPSVLPSVLPSKSNLPSEIKAEPDAANIETISEPSKTVGNTTNGGTFVGKSVGTSDDAISTSQPNCGQWGQSSKEIDPCEEAGLTWDEVEELERLAKEEDYLKVGDKICVIFGPYQDQMGRIAAKGGNKFWCDLEANFAYRKPAVKVPLTANVLRKIRTD